MCLRHDGRFLEVGSTFHRPQDLEACEYSLICKFANTQIHKLAVLLVHQGRSPKIFVERKKKKETKGRSPEIMAH